MEQARWLQVTAASNEIREPLCRRSSTYEQSPFGSLMRFLLQRLHGYTCLLGAIALPNLSRLALAVRGKCRTSLSAPQKPMFNPEDHFSYIFQFQTSLFKFHNSTIDNRPLFASLTSRLQRANEAGGGARKLEPKHALAQVPLRVRSVTRSTSRLRHNSTKF